ncbi:uncharacterized protein EV154DRAFT_551937 [Mucor mucedo]|uniref:uncharacterized protein n=1 Tax=Mucor mucedo TaxID=29922 RepID=UPI00221E6328|nr:uncharacterized protein EV154DRAFT_551937 [Mucor mucedo]KAI7890912.1 hypothetical protein EV154DRAFT_551937 [Mucor mucedo]
MYVYGGRHLAVVGHSSDMYEYNFDTPNGETATMSLVKQINQGPSCSFCGAVMIDDSHMMILSHKFANSSASSRESRTVVRPYIFDFVSLTWTEKEVPTYNQTDESAFYMRARHGTVLGKDGMIYVIGGTNFYEDRNPLTTSYYYDPVLNYYGIIDNNGFDYKTIGPSTFNLPDGNIGSVFGRYDAYSRSYNSDATMMVLHTKTKTWHVNQTLSLPSMENTQRFYDSDEGIAAQLIPNTDCAVFPGLFHVTDTSLKMKNRTKTYAFKNLNLITNTWNDIQTETYQNFPRHSIYASSVVMSNRYLVFAFGFDDQYPNSHSFKDIDIFDLLYQKPDYKSISSDNFSFEWVPTISQYKRLAISGTGTEKNYASKKDVHAVFNKSLIFSVVGEIKHKIRAGETFSTQISGLVTNLIFVVLLMLFVAYFAYSIINSSVSSTEESFEANDVPFPDVRICYNGWIYRSYNDTDGEFPYFQCSKASNPYGFDYCEDVHKLPRSILSPKFMASDTKCQMYASPKDKLNYIHQNVYLEFDQLGEAPTYFGESIHIQLYEPTKNPNRVVFDISPFPHQYSAEYLDNWIDFQLNNSFVHGTAAQKVTLGGLAGASLHFKITYTQKIDPDSLWNLMGIFPKYIQLSDISIVNTAYQLNTISIYPLDQQKTVITEKRDVTIMSTLGVLGGIASMLITIRALLFGARPPNPWGVFQSLSFKLSWGQSKSKTLQKYFRIPGVDNIPFATPVHHRFSDIYTLNKDHSLAPDSSKSRNQEKDGLFSEVSASDTQIESSSIHSGTENDKNKESSNSYYNVHERLEQLEARNQILELVLKAYYIDDRIFSEIHKNSKKEVNTESTPLSEEEKEN